MNTLLLSINWNPNPELFNLFGLSIRYYGLLWAVGIFLAYVIVHYQYRDKKIDEKKFDPLFFYCFFGILIGARLGHCLFYDPGQYLTSGKGFVEMLLPIKFLPAGGWKFTGYEGLASHGGTLGLIIALWLYCRKTKLHYMDVLDMIAVATPITACCIRLANLMNSEIIGKPSDVPWAFIFERVDMQPRHPGQLYEAIAYLILFFIMIYLYKNYSKKLHRGFFFGLCLTYARKYFVLYTVAWKRQSLSGGLRLQITGTRFVWQVSRVLPSLCWRIRRNALILLPQPRNIMYTV